MFSYDFNWNEIIATWNGIEIDEFWGQGPCISIYYDHGENAIDRQKKLVGLNDSIIICSDDSSGNIDINLHPDSKMNRILSLEYNTNINKIMPAGDSTIIIRSVKGITIFFGRGAYIKSFPNIDLETKATPRLWKLGYLGGTNLNLL